LVDVFVPVWVCIRTSHARYRQNTCQNTCQYVLVCIEYIPIPPLRIGHVLMHVFRYVFACINYWYVPIHTKYASNTCKIRINTDWYVSIHTRHVSIHALNTYKNTYQNTYQYGAVVLVRICTYQVSIRALHFPDGYHILISSEMCFVVHSDWVAADLEQEATCKGSGHI